MYDVWLYERKDIVSLIFFDSFNLNVENKKIVLYIVKKMFLSMCT